MAGAAGESILLAIAVAKIDDGEKVLKDYASAGGISPPRVPFGQHHQSAESSRTPSIAHPEDS